MKKVIYYILALATILRLISINQSLWLDEATSATVAKTMNVSQIYNNFLPHDFHPPLYYFTLKAWGSVFGFSDIALRLLSVSFGVATVYVIYLIGHELKNRILGILSALLLATSPLFIYYSQEVRMYAMAAFFVTLSVYAFIKLTKKPEYKDWILYSLSLVGVALTDYLSLFIVPVFIALAFTFKKKSLWNRKFFAEHVPLLIALAAFGPILKSQLVSGIGVKTGASNWWNILGKTNLKNASLVPVKFVIGRVGFDNKIIYALVIVAVFIPLIYLFFQAKKEYKKYKIVWLWLIVPLCLAAVVGIFVPVFIYFRFIFVLPAFYILLSAGLLKVKEDYFLPFLSFAVIVNLVFTGMYLSNKKFQREGWRGLVNFVQNESKDKSYEVVFPANSQMEAYKYYSPESPLSGPSGVEEDKNIIWLMRYVSDVFDPKDTTRKKVEDLGYKKVSEYNFNGVIVWKYENSN